jgi:acyl-CoA hydrolase
MERPSIAAELAARRGAPEDVLRFIEPGMDIVVGAANGEPVGVVDAIEAASASLEDVKLHQMIPLRSRPYIDGGRPGLRHVSWFLSPHDREAFHRGDCDLVPNSFSDVPRLLRQSLHPRLVLAAVSAPDRHGYFSLGTNAEYAAALIGEVPFFVEVNARMPRTFGANQLHVSDVVGFCEGDHALVEVPPQTASERDHRIAELVAERIPDGATLQVGIGAVPNLVLQMLGGHRELGVRSCWATASSTSSSLAW